MRPSWWGNRWKRGGRSGGWETRVGSGRRGGGQPGCAPSELDVGVCLGEVRVEHLHIEFCDGGLDRLHYVFAFFLLGPGFLVLLWGFYLGRRILPVQDIARDERPKRLFVPLQAAFRGLPLRNAGAVVP